MNYLIAKSVTDLEESVGIRNFIEHNDWLLKQLNLDRVVIQLLGDLVYESTFEFWIFLGDFDLYWRKFGAEYVLVHKLEDHLQVTSLEVKCLVLVEDNLMPKVFIKSI